MKSKTFLLLIALLGIILGGIIFTFGKREETQLTVLENTQEPADDSVIEFTDPVAETEWEKRREECQKKEVGIEIESLSRLMDLENVRINPGETGCVFVGHLFLPTGGRIQFAATTIDYSISKGWPGFHTQGYISRGDEFYALHRGEPFTQPFVPDEIWELDGGGRALVDYGNDFDSTLDFPDIPVSVLINIPQGDFSGIGFGLLYPEDNPHPGYKEDIATLKKVVTSITF